MIDSNEEGGGYGPKSSISLNVLITNREKITKIRFLDSEASLEWVDWIDAATSERLSRQTRPRICPFCQSDE